MPANSWDNTNQTRIILNIFTKKKFVLSVLSRSWRSLIYSWHIERLFSFVVFIEEAYQLGSVEHIYWLHSFYGFIFCIWWCTIWEKFFFFFKIWSSSLVDFDFEIIVLVFRSLYYRRPKSRFAVHRVIRSSYL